MFDEVKLLLMKIYPIHKGEGITWQFTGKTSEVTYYTIRIIVLLYGSSDKVLNYIWNIK